ncbi:MAG: hypothetical protein EA365_01640 [Gloeocapsa sp. DLM2.Bin57]|nr:MAG: hypothetical protein EA365_01640 [Gloeocapsa sp. DLM2.Bin57]
MFKFEEELNDEIIFFQGSYRREGLLVPGVFEHNIYTFGLNDRQDVDISVTPNGGRINLEFYRDSNNNRILDTEDELIERSSQGGTEVLDLQLSEGIYFVHVGIGEVTSSRNELVYELEIDNLNNDNFAPDLFKENTNNYVIESSQYNREGLLIPGLFEQEIYRFELTSREDVRINVSPNGGNVELNLYRDDNSNFRLDTEDNLIGRNHKNGSKGLNKTLAKGTFFVHVGLREVNRNRDDLVYDIDVNIGDNNEPVTLFPNNSTNFFLGGVSVSGSSSSSSSSSDPLFTENTRTFNVLFRDGEYTNTNILIPNESEHDIYTFQLEEERNIDISVSPSNGTLELELYEDTNNNGILDRSDELLDRSNTSGDQSFNRRLQEGTYFVHVGLSGVNNDVEQVDYQLTINSNPSLEMSTLSEDTITSSFSNDNNPLLNQELGQDISTLNSLVGFNQINF